MSVELKTVMGQMNIVGGQWVSDAPNTLAVREPTGRLRGNSPKGDLFVVVEVRGISGDSSNGAGLDRALAETIRNTYYESSSSITAGLRRALQAANDRLLEESYRQTGGAALLGGATAMAVRGEDAFIAATGPSVAYAVTRGVATRFPDASPWLDMADAQATAAPALGRRAVLDVQLYHVHVEPGDILVLGDNRFAARASSLQVEKAVAFQGVEGALTNLGRLTGGHNCTALVVEIQVKKPEAAPSKPSPQPKAAAPTVQRDVARAAVPRAGEDRAQSHVQGHVHGIQRRVDLGKLSQAVPLGHWLGMLGKGLLALLMIVWTGLRTLISRVLPGQEHEVPARRPTAGGQARRVPAPPLPQRALRTVALAIPVVVLLVVGVIYWQQGVARESEFKDLLGQAQAAYQQSLNTDDANARTLLAQSEAKLTQSEAIKPNEPTIGQLRESIAKQKDKVDRVERLYWVGKLHGYDDAATMLRRVIVNGLDVYVLDTGADQVYHHRMDEAGDALAPDQGDPVLVRRGQQIDTAVVGELIDLTWMPAGGNRQTSDLLILESGGLLEYNPSWGLASTQIGNKDTWALPAAVASYFGNFYILDPQANQILRYLPGAQGYTNAAEHYFPSDAKVDLAGAVDMAIDGSVYVLYADGTIRKFEGGSAADFKMSDLDRPLSRPTAIFAAPDDVARYIYIADSGNRRVVQLNKDGHFVRQFKPRDENTVDFDTLQSIFVDELTGKLYFLTSHGLYIANITPVQ
jgi:hypothetical protein